MLGSEELDRYFPDRKVGVYVTTWNMQGEKVAHFGKFLPAACHFKYWSATKVALTLRAFRTTWTTSSFLQTLSLHKTFTLSGSRKAVLTGAPCSVRSGL